MADLDPLTGEFAAKYPDSFAKVLTRGTTSEISQVLQRLPPALTASIVARLPSVQIDELMSSGQHDPQLWLTVAPLPDAITLLSRIPRARRLTLVNALRDRERRQRLLRHQQYPTHSVGALVRDVPIRIGAGAAASEVLQELRALGGEDPGPLVVVDAQGRYVGLLNLWRLLSRERPLGTVGDFVVNVAPILAETSIESAAGNKEWHRQNWLPVVDHQRRILGAVSRARVLQAAAVQGGRHTASAGDTAMELLDGLVYRLGVLLETLLAPAGPRR